MKAARYLNMSPLELWDAPIVLRNLALAVESSLDWAEVELMKRAQKSR